MTAVIPKIQVYKKDNPLPVVTNTVGRVCIIGAFDSEETNPVVCTDLDDAYTKLGNDDTFDGCKVLPYIFRGATGVLAMNITTWSDDTTPVPTKTLTTTNITNALAKVKDENFDMLFIAGVLTDAFIELIKAWCDTRFQNKMATGWVGGCTQANISAYTTTAGKVGDHCYGLIANQPVTLEGTDLDLLTTSAYYCALVCDTDLGASLTQKSLPDVTGLVTEYPLETVSEGISGKDLVGLGFTVFSCYDRENDDYIVVNSEQPNGYDLYINRVRDFVVREFQLRQFLGERNRAASLEVILQECARVRKRCIEDLDLLEDIEYNVVKKDVSTVDINLTKLAFAGIITELDVYITIEVE